MKWRSCILLGFVVFVFGCTGGTVTPTPTGKGGIRRMIDRPRLLGQLKQIGLAYEICCETNPPRKIEDLMPFLDNNPQYEKLLRDGDVVVFWGVRPTQVPNPSATILAYEKEPDDKGARLVLTADKSVKSMPKDEFEKAPKAKGNP
jgi:hypothetical protein